MRTDDEAADEPSRVAAIVEGLFEFLDDVVAEDADGRVFVERMRIETPLEFYVRADGDGGRVLAIESRSALGTRTSVTPVLHGLSLVVEVDRAGQREPVLEP